MNKKNLKQSYRKRAHCDCGRPSKYSFGRCEVCKKIEDKFSHSRHIIPERENPTPEPDLRLSVW